MIGHALGNMSRNKHSVPVMQLLSGTVLPTDLKVALGGMIAARSVKYLGKLHTNVCLCICAPSAICMSCSRYVHCRDDDAGTRPRTEGFLVDRAPSRVTVPCSQTELYPRGWLQVSTDCVVAVGSSLETAVSFGTGSLCSSTRMCASCPCWALQPV